jgi:tRNA (cmo5U34)-methyltransferase
LTERQHHADFDSNPPVPVSEYEQTVVRVNVGYDLLFSLTGCFLSALHQPNLEILVVGAGGGAEVERFLPGNPGWRLTGFDPSQDMLAIAQTKVDRFGLSDRVTLIRGTVDDLPADARFDAATCIYVLHFLTDDAKLDLLKKIAHHLRPGAPLFLGTGARAKDAELPDDFFGAWQQYGEMMGMPAERIAALIQQIKGAGPITSQDDYVRLMHEAGFNRVAPYLHALSTFAWIAR